MVSAVNLRCVPLCLSWTHLCFCILLHSCSVRIVCVSCQFPKIYTQAGMWNKKLIWSGLILSQQITSQLKVNHSFIGYFVCKVDTLLFCAEGIAIGVNYTPTHIQCLLTCLAERMTSFIRKAPTPLLMTNLLLHCSWKRLLLPQHSRGRLLPHALFMRKAPFSCFMRLLPLASWGRFLPHCS